MKLTVSSDKTRLGGGFAILRVDGAAPNAIALEDRSSGLYLDGAGTWSKQPTYFKVDAIDASSVSLGPAIVDFIPSDTPVAVHSQSTGLVGNIVWSAIPPSAGTASGAVLPDRMELDFAITAVGAVALAGESAQPPAVAPPPPLAKLIPPPLATAVPPALSVAPPQALRQRSPIGHWMVPTIAFGLVLTAFATIWVAGLIQRQTCAADGALRGVSIAGAIISCPITEAPRTVPPEAPKIADPEGTAYTGYLECLAGKSGCSQKVCADKYLSAFQSAAHAGVVNAARREIDRTCRADDDYIAFNECMRTTANACDRGGCVERFGGRLTAEPYASNVRQAAQMASSDCKRGKEETAIAAFNQCVSANSPCDTAKCSSAFTSAFPASAYISNVLQVAENSARTCATSRLQPQPQEQMPVTPVEPTISPAVLQNEATNAGKGLAHAWKYKGLSSVNETIMRCRSRAQADQKIETAIYCATFDVLATVLHEQLARSGNYEVLEMNQRDAMNTRVNATWATAGFSRTPDVFPQAISIGKNAFDTELNRINAMRAAPPTPRREKRCIFGFCN